MNKFNKGERVILEIIEGDVICEVKAYCKDKFSNDSSYVYLLEDLITLEPVIYLNKKWIQEKLIIKPGV
jgi:hypothetical protein